MQITLRAPDRLPPPSARPPLVALEPAEVEALHDELVAYHAAFAPLFHRAEQRHWALRYLEGQLLPLERKSIEPMADALVGGNVQAMQQFISAGAWEDDAVLAKHQALVAATLGDAATGVLLVDGCDFPKQGSHSVGVARQYCGPPGKVANCQASVIACYASARGYTLVDRRLYLPEDWFSTAYQERWDRCGIPDETTFQTRTALAWGMIAALHARGALPFRWVTGDEHFGNTPMLLDQIAAAELAYFMEVPHNVRVWPERPLTAVPAATGRKGHPHTRVRLAPDAPTARRVDALAAQLPASAWQVAQIQDGSKGPLVAEVAFVRAVAVRDGLPGPDVWVVFRRALDATRELKAYLCNAAADTPPETLVWLLGLRWPIEQAIKEGKEELGLDHYEVRGWRGWHHHTTMTLLAQHFLMRLRCRLGGDGPGADRPPGAASPERDAPGPAPRRGGDARVHPRGPAPQLCGGTLAPQATAAPTPPPPRYLLSQVTL
jgi:SRSO17 transposase